MSPSSPDSLGPVSRHLRDEVCTTVRQRGIVVWLDRGAEFSDFVADLADEPALAFPVVRFTGSHLETMLALHPLASGADPVPLLVHLPGFNRDRVQASPFLELYRAGREYRPALDTVIRDAAAGKVPPKTLDAWLAERPRTLADADAWLAAQLADDGEDPLAQRTLAEVYDGLLDGRMHVSGALIQGLERAVGLDGHWRQRAGGTADPKGETLAFGLAAYALCVEYVHDLKHRDPHQHLLQPLAELHKDIVAACRALAQHLRDRHPERYRTTADEAENWLGQERATASAEDLGKVDTFRFEEDKVLTAALGALGREEWQAVTDWAEPRLAGQSFWVQQKPTRRHAWELLAAGAALGAALTDAGPDLGDARDLEDAVGAYVERGAAVDRAHRHLEQLRVRLLTPGLPDYEALRRRLDEIRTNWRHWADIWSEAWLDLCAAHGFLPPSSLQQRTLFDDVVRPWVDDDAPTVLFMVDALRFEMAQELADGFSGLPGTTVHLRPRLAELPSETFVGMNALAPVSDRGHLRPTVQGQHIQGFHTGEFLVGGPADRKRAMHQRVGGATCPMLDLEEVLRSDRTTLRRSLARARLAIVHSIELDKAGEVGLGPQVFPQVLVQLQHAREALHAAGVRRFVFTSDHGFLMLDDTIGERKHHGRKVDPQRRHVILDDPAEPVGEVCVAMRDLKYDGVDQYISFPRTTAVFDRGKHSLGFVHGGPSFQERVIPVLTVEHRAPAGSDATRYRLQAFSHEGLGDMHCIRGQLDIEAQGGLPFGGSREVALALRVTELDGVRVELCDRRGAARIEGGVVHAQVGESFELFFRLFGPTRDRVRVELYHPGTRIDVAPAASDARYSVRQTRRPEDDQGGTQRLSNAWLDDLPPPARKVFQHLDAHGSITEREVADLLGSPRAARRFARHLDDHVRLAPFDVRVDATNHMKRFIREGSSQ